MTIQTNATDRKKLAKSIAEFTGNEIHYMGPPTFAYAVGNYIIDRAGVITSESEEGEAELRTHLETQGFLDREITELAVSVPLMDMDAEAMKRLVFMLHSKQYLLNKAVGLPCQVLLTLQMLQKFFLHHCIHPVCIVQMNNQRASR